MEKDDAQSWVGRRAEFNFVIRSEDMTWFRQLSQDTSLIHTDPAFAQAHYYDDVVVYGGLQLAQLSRLLGRHLPGACGVSAEWSIAYRAPLYVNEEACLTGEVTQHAVSAGVIEISFEIYSITRGLLSKGKARSRILA